MDTTVDTQNCVDAPNWPAAMRAVGMRVTKQRLAVLDALARTPHATVEDLLRDVSETLNGISAQSIYKVVTSLDTAGFIRKVDLPNSAARYEIEEHNNHHHMVCSSCGRIEDVACAVGHAPCLHPSEHHGMRIDVADVIYRGLCRYCVQVETEDPRVSSDS